MTGADASGVVAALRDSRPELVAGVFADDQPWSAREWLLASWAAALESNEGARHVLFQAEPGFGKTVVSAQFALRVAAAGQHVAAVFFRRGYASLEDPLGVVERLSNQLAELLPGFREERELARLELGAGNPLELTVEGPVTVDARQIHGGSVTGVQIAPPSGRPVERAWRCDIADPFSALHKKGVLPRVLIVVDGLDETSEAVLRMLADGLTLLPEPVRMLMTARPGTEPPIGDPAARATVLRLAPDLGVSLAVNPMDARQADEELITAWVRQRLAAARDDDAWASQLARRIASEAGRTFLVAVHITDDLVQRFPRGTAVPPADQIALPTGGLGGVYDSFLSRLFGSSSSPLWRTRGRPLLGLLSVSRDAGLTPGMLSSASGLGGSDVADALHDCAAFVRRDDRSIWRIWHRTFAEHLYASDAFPVRPWDWHLALGTALAPLALGASAATVEDADYRRLYAAQHAAVHLLDAAQDPDAIASDAAATSLRRFVNAGQWVEALVALAGPVASAEIVERLAAFDPSVPLGALADALRDDAHILTGEATRFDGFAIGQLSLRAARSRDPALTTTLESWSGTSRSGLLTAWTSEAASPGHVITTHPLGIIALAVVDLAEDTMYLTGGLDGRVRAVSLSGKPLVSGWEDPARRPVSALTACARGSEAIVAIGTPEGTRVLRWPPSGVPVELWAAEDGPVRASLAVNTSGRSGSDVVNGDFVLVSSHADGVLKARDLITGEKRGNPPEAAMPVWALDVVEAPSSTDSGPQIAVIAASTSDSGRTVVWSPIHDRTMGDVLLGGPVTALASPGAGERGPLAVGYYDGTIRLWSVSAHDGTVAFSQGPSRSVGRTKKAAVETVSALAWVRDDTRVNVVAGDTAGRIHRLDPLTMTRSASWIAGHASTVSSLVPSGGDGGFVSAGADGVVKSWVPSEINADAWPEQVLTLDVVKTTDEPPVVACGHTNGEISLRSAHDGEVLARQKVHDAPIWALAWTRPAFGLVSGDSTGGVMRSQIPGGIGRSSRSAWENTKLAQFSAQVSSVAAGADTGEPVVSTSTLFNELAIVTEDGRLKLLPPVGGVPLGLRLVQTTRGTAFVVEREVPRDATVITGEPPGRRLDVMALIPETGDDAKPDWHLWWDEPEMLGAWDTAVASTATNDGNPVLIVGLRDGAVLVFDLEEIVTDPNRPLDAYQTHEAWPHRAPITTLTAAYVSGVLMIAWTTEDGWLFVQGAWEEAPLRMYLGSRILASKVTVAGLLFLGGTNGVTGIRIR